MHMHTYIYTRTNAYLCLKRYRQRQLAFHVQYDGTAYAGFASQDCEDTVENHLFKAFLKLRLITDRQVTRGSRIGARSLPYFALINTYIHRSYTFCRRVAIIVAVGELIEGSAR